MCHKLTVLTRLVFLLSCSIFIQETAAQNLFPDTLWVPVIFYDYWIDNNGTNPDFEIAPAQMVTGMVYDTLDNQHKPIPTPIACPTPSTDAPAACHLSEWYRVSGSNGSDMSCLFKCDSVTNPKMMRWFWTKADGSQLTPYLNRVGEYVGPNYDSTYNMRNIIIYDSLPFLHLGKTDPAQLGVYEYNNGSFFQLDNRGFGNQPSGQRTPHNFGFTMELHTKFIFKTGMNLTFAGDDDCWVFINGKKVVDLGGRHSTLQSSINLDTMSGFEVGKEYPLDFFYAERHTTGSDIRITSNIIAAQPQSIKMQVIPGDTICPGDTVRIIGTLIGSDGKAIPELSDSISWSLVSDSTRTGDQIRAAKSDSTWFTGTVAWRRAGIIGSYLYGTVWIRDTDWIYIKACTPSQLDIVKQSATSLTASQAITSINLNQPSTPLLINFDTTKSHMYAYVVLRDRYGNFVQIADAPSWLSRQNSIVTVQGTPGKLFEGAIGRTPVFQPDTVWIVVSQGSFTPDSAMVVLPTSTPPPNIKLTSAVTKDLNGNGLIDHIEITFDKSITLTNSMVSSFVLKGNGNTFTVDSITKVNDSTYVLNVHEIKTSIPQTSWTPYLSIVPSSILPSITNFLTTDGCPPVVWQVIKYPGDSTLTFDTIKIVLSEKITGASGSPLSATSPSDLFNVWKSDSVTAVNGMFSGIHGFTSIVGDSILVFVMSNGKDLTTDNLINLRSDDSIIKDNAGNFPTVVNQRIRVTMGGITLRLVIGPNPGTPSLVHPGPLLFANEPNATTWAMKNGNGTVISIKNITRPTNSNDEYKVKGVIKILDIVGNSVNWNETGDIFTQLDNSKGTAKSLDIYWNGANQSGMLVAPGIYRVVVYINYPSDSHIPNSKVVSKIGIRH
jgi:fibro-slime domain-containing protein